MSRAYPVSHNQMLFSAARASNHRRSICAGYALFADRKQQWIAAHPEATQAEFDRAIARLSRECGV